MFYEFLGGSKQQLIIELMLIIRYLVIDFEEKSCPFEGRIKSFMPILDIYLLHKRISNSKTFKYRSLK